MITLIINIIGWIVGGATEARANRIRQKTEEQRVEEQKQIVEILGASESEAAKEGTKQGLLKAIQAKTESGKSQVPVLVITGGLLAFFTMIYFHYRSKEN